MGSGIDRVIADIDGLTAVAPDGLDLDRLQSLADEYFTSPEAPAHLDVWFRLYERFPEFDGHGVFWTILHGIEAQPNSDGCVVASVRRRPSRFPLLMVNRMLNGGIKITDGVDLVELLQTVAADEWCLAGLRRDAERFLELQRRRAGGGRL
jgi:hypothetical protein